MKNVYYKLHAGQNQILHTLWCMYIYYAFYVICIYSVFGYTINDKESRLDIARKMESEIN